MDEFQWPTYVLDLRNPVTLSRVECLKEGRTVAVLVRQEENALAPSIAAKAQLIGNVVHVVVETKGGEQRHEWNYGFLMNAVKMHREMQES